ncbi:MAG: kelch repeat-containing protein [Myxococcota bacterium]
MARGATRVAAAAAVGLAPGCREPTQRPGSPQSAPPASSGADSGQTEATSDAAPRRPLRWELVDTRLPVAVANNAVASVATAEGPVLVSMMGLSGAKTHADIVRTTMTWVVGTGAVRQASPTPGAQGRLASSAVSLDGSVLLFGGYTVAPDGHEVSVPQIERYDPAADTWGNAGSMPTPVDDAVVAVWRDRVVLVSGWSNVDNVDHVQWWDPGTGRFTRASPIIGPPVFGHAGGVLGDTIVYCDGVTKAKSPPRFAAVHGCFLGRLSPEAPERIAWEAIADHPGRARYRVAAGRYDAEGLLVFAGGTDNPYNYDGVGYDREPSEPVTDVFAWDGAAWRELPPLPEPLMDHRGLVEASGSLFLLGGLDAERQPSDRIYRLGPASRSRR